MSLRDELTQPIGGDNPAGENLRYDSIYDEIKDARRFDDPNEPRGAFERDLKKADQRGSWVTYYRRADEGRPRRAQQGSADRGLAV